MHANQKEYVIKVGQSKVSTYHRMHELLLCIYMTSCPWWWWSAPGKEIKLRQMKVQSPCCLFKIVDHTMQESDDDNIWQMTWWIAPEYAAHCQNDDPFFPRLARDPSDLGTSPISMHACKRLTGARAKKPFSRRGTRLRTFSIDILTWKGNPEWNTNIVECEWHEQWSHTSSASRWVRCTHGSEGRMVPQCDGCCRLRHAE